MTCAASSGQQHGLASLARSADGLTHVELTHIERRIENWIRFGRHVREEILAADRREAAFAKRLDQLDRRLARTERDVGIGIETLAVFIRFWLATTPALPEPAAQAARAQAGERYDAFVTALGRRLAKGPRLRQEIPEDSMGEAGSVQPLRTE